MRRDGTLAVLVGLLGLIGAGLTPAALAAGPRIVDLGADFHPVAVNSSSVVAGNHFNVSRGARWKDGVVTTLGPLTSPVAYLDSSASDINEDGTVVGRSADFSGSPAKARATVWPLMGSPSGIAPAVDNVNIPMSEAYAINDSGLVAGGSAHCTGMACGFPQAATGSAGGTFSLLPPDPGGTGSSYARDVNNAGVVVGTFGVGSIWTGGSQTLLGDFRPWSINDGGVMVGDKGPSALPYVRATDGTLSAIPANGYVHGINDNGDIVGAEKVSPFDGWVVHQGTVYYVDDLLPAGTTGWDLSTATAIADNGDIVGEATHNSTSVGYLLTPDYPGFRLFGSVLTTDGQPVANVALAVTGPTNVNVTTDKFGQYSVDLQDGTYTITSLDDAVRPKPQPGCGASACTVTINGADVQVDFEKGCQRSLTMGAGFAGVNGCFVKTGDTQFETTEPFRFNGLDVVPTGKITFDTLRAQMTGGPLALRLGEDTVLQNEAVDWSFATTTFTFTPPPLATRIRGLPISGTISATMIAGTTTITGTLAVPKDVRARFSPFTGWTASQPDLNGQYSASLTATTTNPDGLRTIGISLAPGDIVKFPLRPGTPDDPAAPKAAVTLREIRGVFDLDHHVWSLGAKVSVPMPAAAGGAVPASPAVPGKSGGKNVELDGTITFSDGFLPVKILVLVNGIDVPIEPPGIYLQRLSLDFGLTGLQPLDPFVWTAGVGISLGKRLAAKYVNVGGVQVPLVPNELVSADGKLTLQDLDKNPLTLEDTTYAGDVALKFWDQPVASGGATWYIGLGSLEFRGKAGFEDPTGKLFVVTGTAKGWWDADAQTAFLEGHGTVHIKELIENDLDYVVSTKGLAACAGEDGKTYGITYEWATHREHIGGCDLGSFRGTPLLPKVRASAAAVRFRLGPGEGLAALRVKGTRFSLRGPGVNVAGRGGKAFRTGRVRVIPVPADGATYVILVGPKAGTYTLSGASSPRFAKRLPEPAVTGTLSGNGCAPALTWKARSIAGQQVRIVDAATNGHVVVSTSSKQRGRATASGVGAGVRRIEAQVLQGGGMRATIPLAKYVPVAGSKPIATGIIRPAGGRVLWDPVCGATAYDVKVGRAKARRVKGASLAARLRPGTRVTVTALGRRGAKGPPASGLVR